MDKLIIVMQWQTDKGNVYYGELLDRKYNQYIIKMEDDKIVEIPIRCCSIANIIKNKEGD